MVLAARACGFGLSGGRRRRAALSRKAGRESAAYRVGCRHGSALLPPPSLPPGMSSGPCWALREPDPRSMPNRNRHVPRQPKPCRQHGGTGIGANRDIAVLWCDIAPPCASPPTAPPTERRTPARNPRFSTCSGLVCVRHGLSAGGEWIRTSGSAMRLSSPTERPWSRPPDLAVSGGALNGHLTTPIGGRPATRRLTRREDRSAQLRRGPEDLVIGRQRTIGFLTGSASSVVRTARAELRSLGPPSTLWAL